MGKRSSGRALHRRIPVVQVSEETQEKAGLVRRRAGRIEVVCKTILGQNWLATNKSGRDFYKEKWGRNIKAVRLRVN